MPKALRLSRSASLGGLDNASSSSMTGSVSLRTDSSSSRLAKTCERTTAKLRNCSSLAPPLMLPTEAWHCSKSTEVKVVPSIFDSRVFDKWMKSLAPICRKLEAVRDLLSRHCITAWIEKKWYYQLWSRTQNSKPTYLSGSKVAEGGFVRPCQALGSQIELGWSKFQCSNGIFHSLNRVVAEISRESNDLVAI